jgi:hypothetical protein
MKAILALTLLTLVCITLGTNCPDKSTCSGTGTCCQLQDGKYGCCPYKKADCCEDKQHCCPEGYECDVQRGQCIHKINGITQNFVPVHEPSNDKCGDGSSCPTSNTCCQLASGGYGCCPYAKATCCSDKQHCCPNGYQCDIKQGQCVKGIEIVSTLAMGKVKETCKDGSQCGSGTCCELESGGYGCCPYEDATCCDDKQHCCPNGYQCDIPHMRCVQGNTFIPKTFAGIKDIKAAPVKDTCKDGSQCGSGTCCELESGGYGCCPYEDATCCDDKQHCCPNGYQCDIPHMRCVQGKTFTSVKDIKASPVKDTCKDGSQCGSGTCCELESGGYGCCPYEDATCCDDKQHCCPNGYQCDIPHMRCVQGNTFTSVKTIKAAPVKETCKDGSQCGSGTCCELESGGYGCCPYEDATCCDDKQHCCPNGYQCDIPHMRCVQGKIITDVVSMRSVKTQ